MNKGLARPSRPVLRWYGGKWIRREDWHYGSFYFWGETPALLPTGCPRKGFGGGEHKPEEPFGFQRDGRRVLRPNQFPGEYERKGGLKKSPFATPSERVNAMKLKKKNISVGRDAYRKIGGEEQVGHHKTSLREKWSAEVAMIPIELAEWIGKIYNRQANQEND